MPSETAKASLGYVTSYGAARRGGYQGTYEEWCALMAEVADHLEQNESLYADTTTAKEAAEAAQGYAEVAQGKAEDAQTAAETAQGKAEDAEDAAEAWAAGTSGGTPSATNNASYYAGQASDSATASAASAASAEAWATGGSSGTSSATNNAKYYSDQAEDSAEAAEAWATGGSGGTASASNNAKYYSEQAATSATAAAAVGTNFAPTFSSSTAYSAGDYVMYNGTQYRFTANHAAGAWTGSDAVAEPISPVVADLKTQLEEFENGTFDVTRPHDYGKDIDSNDIYSNHLDYFAITELPNGGFNVKKPTRHDAFLQFYYRDIPTATAARPITYDFAITIKDSSDYVSNVRLFEHNTVIASTIEGSGAPLVKEGDTYKFTYTYSSQATMSFQVAFNPIPSFDINIVPYAILHGAVDEYKLKPKTFEDYLNNRIFPWEYCLDKILCIGDSLTVGVPASISTMPNPMKQNYPRFLGRMLNSEVTNAGVSSITTSGWYNSQYDNYTMTDYDAVIIFLGTNGLFTDTLETDVDPYSDYNDYADTNTGCYCKLIEHIKADNPNCNIVLVNIWRESNISETLTADLAREMIDKFGQKYSLPVVDTKDLAYSYNPEYHGGYDNVHMAKSGYLALAARIISSLREYISEHISYANIGMTL